jgi:hypothetical protein
MLFSTDLAHCTWNRDIVGEVGAKSQDILRKMPTPKQQFPLPVMHLGLI